MSTEQMDQRTRQLWHQAYLAGERLIAAEETVKLLTAEDAPWRAYGAALVEVGEAKARLGDLLISLRVPLGGERLVDGAGGLLDLALCDEGPMAVWREEPIDVRPVRPERLWDGRRLPVTTQDRGGAPIGVEVENVG